MNLTRAQLQELLRVVAATEPEEIDCDELLTRVGAFLEGQSRGDPPPAELRMVSQHLEVCPECRDEFDALVALHLGP